MEGAVADATKFDMFNKIIGAVVATTMLASTGFLCARTIVGNNAIFAIPAIAQAIKTCADPAAGASLGLPVTESACR